MAFQPGDVVTIKGAPEGDLFRDRDARVIKYLNDGPFGNLPSGQAAYEIELLSLEGLDLQVLAEAYVDPEDYGKGVVFESEIEKKE